MPKEFYTERDIEDLHRRGVTSLQLGDDVVLTELAFEKAGRLGVALVRGSQPGPVIPPAAPVRPYVSQLASPAAAPCPNAATPVIPAGEVAERIRAAVQAKLGPQVDPALLDVIIRRVLAGTGVT
ncbi:MAG: hypothetical protein MUF78_08415 [Candidatus Edwardsbacteria bacterium]|nr:hypothetical protein [Candidatus Edwardsbacteria bacterium]